MRYFIFIVLILFPFFVLSQEYQNEGGAAQMVADSFSEIYTFMFTDVPNVIQRFFAWLIIWLVKAKLYAQLEFMQFSWGIAKQIILDLNIMSEITSKISVLPADVRQALVSMRFFDGVNLLLNAYMTKFVMNLMRTS